MKRILFVEPESTRAEAIERALRPKSDRWEVVFRDRTTSALAAFAASPFDVVVTDLDGDALDGIELLSRIKVRHPETARILLADPSRADVSLRAIPIAHQLLMKPCSPRLLEDVIDRTCTVQTLVKSERLQRTVGGVDVLPSLPRIYYELSQALARSDAVIGDVARIVEQDIGMSAKVLQMVNSAFFRLPLKITNVPHAVSYLGLDTIRSIVLSLAAFSEFQGAALLPEISFEKEQVHALLSANIARKLVPDTRTAETAFTAGMLHDLGKLVLATRLPGEFSRALTTARESGRPLHEVETELLGVTHAEVGAYLIGLWGLPFPVVEAIAHHHDPDAERHTQLDAVGAVHIANVLAHEQSNLRRLREPEAHDLGLDYVSAIGLEHRLPEWRSLASDAALATGPA